MPIVSISHTTGAGGELVGGLVSKRLDFQYIDEEIVRAAAEKHGIEPELVADAERRKRVLVRIVESLGTGGWVQAAGGGVAIPDLGALPGTDDIGALIREAILEIASRGNVVIVSHAASFALAGLPGLVRVFVTAPTNVRARRVAAAEGISEGDAASLIKRSDAGRADYLKRFHDIDRELPTHYDLVVNTEALSNDRAADVVASAVRP